ncbi:MAG TPA: MOSC N-terminal beta barrel domain-containing protein [Candidatus Binataceae bacterium]|nr:MOSC N-terminal beta barrel domain-containing protein [Candidatus Binataceae bacterium]
MATVGKVAEIWRYPFKSMGGQKIDRVAIGPNGLVGDRGWALRDEAAGEIRGAKKLPALMQCQAKYLAEPGEGVIPHVEITLPSGERVKTSDAGIAAKLSAFLGRAVTPWPLQPPSALDHYRHGQPDNPDIMVELREIFGRTADEPLPDLEPFVKIGLIEFTSPLGTYFDAFPLHLVTTATLKHLGGFNSNARFDVRRFRPNILIELDNAPDDFVEAQWSGKHLRIGAALIDVVGPCPRCVMTTLPQEGLAKDPSVLRTIVKDAAQNVGIYASPASSVALATVAVGDRVELN